MGVKLITKKNEFPKMLTSLEAFDGVKLNVGVLRGESQWLAGIHEYGCRIPVTNKMRAFLHRCGIHLKKSTKEIVIPERSFLRAGFDANEKDIIELCSRWVRLVENDTVSYDDALRRMGEDIADIIRDYAVELDTPPNSTWTTDWKGSTNPLVDTGDMINGITYEVERK